MREPTIEELGEDRLLDRIRKAIDPVSKGMLGIGDDAAVVPSIQGRQLLTTDTLVENVHFRRAWCLPEEVGWKALAVNLSDVAAMGGWPVAALVSLVLPPQTTVRAVLGLYGGMRKLARRTGVAILGGNLAKGSLLSIGITVIGDSRRGGPLLRSGARPGDRLFVSGEPGLARLGYLLLDRQRRLSATDPWRGPGGSILDRRQRVIARFPGAGTPIRRFLLPDPRLFFAQVVLPLRPSAMMDVSDGLAADLPRLARASGVRLVVETTKLPASYAFRRMCSKLEVPFEKVILSGGEDYELVMTLPGPAPSPDEVSWTCIGEVAAGRGVVLRDEKGRSRPLAVRGFDHFKRR